MKKIAVIFGTRPEAIKLGPLIWALKAKPGVSIEICLTGQHREMLDQVLDVFAIHPDLDLKLMTKGQTLATFSARALLAIDDYLSERHVDQVVVQGDTTTALCASMASFYRHVSVAHVEAGLRTGRMDAPFPEEMNRVLTARLATVHFAPTTQAKENLINEGVPETAVHVTGNTVVDALLHIVAKVRSLGICVEGLPEDICGPSPTRPIVLITSHRRESFGEGFEHICLAIRDLAKKFHDVDFVYPVHLNPNVRDPVRRILSDQPGVYLLGPLDYLSFVALMDRCAFVLSDSGGIQEEAPSLGKQVLVMRDVTERPEALLAGTSILVGTQRENIVAHVTRALSRLGVSEEGRKMINPFGDGHASERIASILCPD